ncbi:MAG TPA: hypothetical protein VGE55_05875 [Limnobacter sp.]|uniref:hypothetical protein n=1 Tax=Limnobacter sp. TaxID=2003368 RepID=UPI002ED83BB3
MNKTWIALSLTALLPAVAQASEAELLEKINKLAAQVESLRAELADTRKKAVALEQSQQQVIQTQVETQAVLASAQQAKPSDTVITGYGEINFNRPIHDRSKTQADVARAVIGFQHRFDEKTKLVTELEWEHAVVSSGDQGETAVEQLYVERELTPGMQAKAGLFLIPSGLLNTNHEPTAYYGVERNFVETAIIPTTWREVGVGLSNSFDNGISTEVGITTGFNLNKWDFSGASDGKSSPLGSVHQEGQLAAAGDLAVYGALNWRGVPGLQLGGSVFTGGAAQSQPGFAASNARVTLWETHGRYNPGALDVSALFARGTISDTAALNLANAGSATPVPSSFQGWYTQAAYQVWQSGDYRLSPFVRYERFNTGRTFEAMPAGLANLPDAEQKVTTVGANFRIGEGVVLKADYQRFAQNRNLDRFDLGVGYSF